MSEPQAQAKKQFLVSWDDFHRDCRVLSEKLLNIRDDWRGVLAVTTGGLVPAGIVSWELETKVIEVMGVSSYSGYDNPNQKEIRVLKDFNAALVGDGKGWLVLDDLVDSGNTIKAIREKLPKAHYAAVYAKPDGESTIDTYAVSVPQDNWIYFPWYLKQGRPVDPIVYGFKKG